MKTKIQAALKADGINPGDTVKAKYFYRLSQEIAGDSPGPVGKFWDAVSQIATRDSFAQDCNWTVKLPNAAAQALRAIKSETRSQASRVNGKKGGRPSIDIAHMLALIAEDGDLCRAGYYRTAYPAEWRKARRGDRINVWRDDTGTEYVSVGRQM